MSRTSPEGAAGDILQGDDAVMAAVLRADLNHYLAANAVTETVSDLIALVLATPQHVYDPNPVGALANLLGLKATGRPLQTTFHAAPMPADIEQLRSILEDAVAQPTAAILDERPANPLLRMAEFLGWPGLAALPATAHGPVIGEVTSTSAVVWFRDEASVPGSLTVSWWPTSSGVEGGEGGGVAEVTPIPEADYTSKTLLTGLAPGTRYNIRVGDRMGSFATPGNAGRV
eukprot:5306677-Prymnesium_polylepis.1